MSVDLLTLKGFGLQALRLVLIPLWGSEICY